MIQTSQETKSVVKLLLGDLFNKIYSKFENQNLSDVHRRFGVSEVIKISVRIETDTKVQ